MFRKVMVVNDDEISLFVSSKMIAKTGFAGEVVTAMNGLKALQVFDSFLLNSKGPNDVPELVFLDLHMPVMDGWEFMEMFAEKYAYIFPSVRFVILSSSIDPDDIQKLKRFSAVIELIRNPLSFEILNRLKEKFGKIDFRFPPIGQLTTTQGQMIA
ncbi:response regulator [Sediminibacterium sp.]|uniref:response regulator n=1 Tax=Sediminibacterium sp. TaxID=1917865 RepID=UPI0025F93F08|nr:response regulator [Sediminibacterium sp.]MBW0178607.1 response regulator [Sediminibacterium sp.]